jgi:hypothetical protein
MLDKAQKLLEASSECLQRDLDACDNIDQGVEVKQIYLGYAVAMLDMLAWGCPPDVSQATLAALEIIIRRLEHNAAKADNDD